MEKEKKIYVFADFLPFQNELIGTIYVSQTRGKEFYSFEYVESWLEKGNRILDPDLQLYKGRQYINDDKNIFGVFAVGKTVDEVQRRTSCKKSRGETAKAVRERLSFGCI